MITLSSVFNSGGSIPPKYTCDGDRLNPPLGIANIPEGTRSLVLIVEDPDAPSGIWTHWMIWNIPPAETEISEASVPSGVIGKSSSGSRSWDPICPPDGEHRYFFRIYALDIDLDLDPESTTRGDLINIMEGHVIDQGELMGRYRRVILA